MAGHKQMQQAPRHSLRLKARRRGIQPTKRKKDEKQKGSHIRILIPIHPLSSPLLSGSGPECWTNRTLRKRAARQRRFRRGPADINAGVGLAGCLPRPPRCWQRAWAPPGAGVPLCWTIDLRFNRHSVVRKGRGGHWKLADGGPFWGPPVSRSKRASPHSKGHRLQRALLTLSPGGFFLSSHLRTVCSPIETASLGASKVLASLLSFFAFSFLFYLLPVEKAICRVWKAPHFRAF